MTLEFKNLDCVQIDDFLDAVEVRAVLESQFMAQRVHAENLGFNIGKT